MYRGKKILDVTKAVEKKHEKVAKKTEDK